MSKIGSLYHQFITVPGLFTNQNRKNQNGDPLEISYQSKKNYMDWLHYAANYFKEQGIRYIGEIGLAEIQGYADHLQKKGYSASTQHNYLAPVCKACKICMDDIDKAIRYTADFTKGHTSTVTGGGAPAALNADLGFRRRELTRLHGNDLQTDKFGNYYVYLDRGKGGKAQRQHIPKEKIDEVKSYFNGENSLLFSKSDMDSMFNYHGQRRNNARNLYFEYAKRLAGEPSYRKELYRAIAEQWHKLNHKHRQDLEPFSFFDKPYKLRGKNAQLAAEQGIPLVLDRLALRAVSVLHLAHWRDNITIDYLFYREDGQLQGYK